MLASAATLRPEPGRALVRGFLSVVLIAAVLVNAFFVSQAAAQEKNSSPESKQETKRSIPPAGEKENGKPIILLTGFEPFGPGRPANPSWESVKGLDGREWNGHRLVARQLPVVWGVPMTQIEEWIAELHPVAIFSFGQGMPGSFAIETRAHNDRSRGARDNLGNPAPAPGIVGNGPSLLEATLPARGMVGLLAEKGYPIRISREAGRYLCEETLYTLEFLKSSKKFPGVVSFCHVPPLGTSAAGKQVTAEYVRGFVLSYLDAWHAAAAKSSEPAPVAPMVPNPTVQPAPLSSLRSPVPSLARLQSQAIWSPGFGVAPLGQEGRKVGGR